MIKQPIVEIIKNLKAENINDKYRNNQNVATSKIKQQLSQQAKKAAQIIVDNFWSNKNAPLKLGNLMYLLDFDIYKSYTLEDSSLSGMLSLNSGNPSYGTRMILINGNDNIGHQRFTIAHELAHYIFDAISKEEYYEAYYQTNGFNDSIREYRANQFAANLLMPDEIFIDRYNYMSNILSNKNTIIDNLSTDFGVSKTAVIRRLEELNINAR